MVERCKEQSLSINPVRPCHGQPSKKPLYSPGETFESETAFDQFWKDHGFIGHFEARLSSATGNLVKIAFSDKPSTVLLRRFYVNKLN